MPDADLAPYSLSEQQVNALLEPIAKGRVFQKPGSKGSHVPGYDVIAQLDYMFGFVGWDKFVVDGPHLVYEHQGTAQKKDRNGKPVGDPYEVWTACYRATVRLVIKDRHGNVIKVSEDSATGVGENQPQRHEAHDKAVKEVVTYGVKRCAKDLGDGFGLSLYNKGSLAPVVGGTLVRPIPVGAVAPRDVQALSMGNDENHHEPAATELVWPHGYINSTPLKGVGQAKQALLDLCDGDKDQAAKVWAEHFDGRPVDLLVLGHLRMALGLAGPAGDDSVVPPLPGAGDGVTPMKDALELAERAAASENDLNSPPDLRGTGAAGTGPAAGPATKPDQTPNPDTPPSKAELDEWLATFDRLANDDILGPDGFKKFKTMGRERKLQSKARTIWELDALYSLTLELYGETHPAREWDPSDFDTTQAMVDDLQAADDPGTWQAFCRFARKRFADPQALTTWTEAQFQELVPWLALGGEGVTDERTAA